MKHLSLFFLGLVTFSASGQSIEREFGLGYTYMAPMGPMQPHIKRGHGFTMDYYLSPAKKPLAFGLEFNYTQYGYDRSEQIYTFDNGTTAPMDIVVDNAITSLMAATRYFFRNDGLLRPYVSGKLGYAWFTTHLNIYDPNAWDDCAPVDNAILLRDGTVAFSVGGGLQYDLSGMFKKMNPNNVIFTLNANLVLGGHVKYMNTDAPEHHQPASTDVKASFINTQTQVVHEHHVGNVYQSYLEMIDFRAGLIFRTNRR
jgi:opacity protein-like surface antigen